MEGALTDLERLSLGAAAARLRTVARTVVEACRRHDRAVPAVLTAWPQRPRRGGWACGHDGDQAEDDRLREVAHVGLRTAADLRRQAPADPLARLAESSMTRAATAYMRTSAALHAVRRHRIDADIGRIRGATADLVDTVERATSTEEFLDTVRLVPPGVAAVAHLLRDDLEAARVAAGATGLRAQFARDLEGTLAVIDAHVESLPRRIVTDACEAGEELYQLDLATGSFRQHDCSPWWDRLRTPAGPVYAADRPDVARLGLAEQQLVARLAEVADRYLSRAEEPSLESILPLAAHLQLDRDLRDAELAPSVLPARDDVYRDHALGIARLFEGYAADSFDSADESNHDLGRSLMRARDAAVQYLAASEELAERVRGEAGGGASTAVAALEAVNAAVGDVRRALDGRGMGEVAVAELACATHDVARARAQAAAPPAAPRRSRVVGSLERQACRSAGWLLAGDAASHLVLDHRGGDALNQLRGAWRQLEAAVGVRHYLAPLPAPAHGEWLTDLRPCHDHAAAVRVGTVIARLRHGRVVDRNASDRGRGSAAAW